MLMSTGWVCCSNTAAVTESSTEGMMIPWQSRALTGCHVLFPTSQKCDIKATVTLSQTATEGGIHPGRLGEAKIIDYSSILSQKVYFSRLTC